MFSCLSTARNQSSASIGSAECVNTGGLPFMNSPRLSSHEQVVVVVVEVAAVGAA